MTVKELKQKLVGVDENLEVFTIQTNNEFTASLIETAEVRSILFTENPEDDETAELSSKEEVFIITDE